MLFKRRILYRLSLISILSTLSHILVADSTGTLSEDPYSIVQHFNNAGCCVYVDQLESVELKKGASLEIDLSETANLLELSTGPTFAKLISIPDSKKKERYSFRTDIIEYDNELFAFFPYLALLDADLNLLGTTHFNGLGYVQKHMFEPKSNLRSQFKVDANIDNDSGVKVKFFLLYTKSNNFTTAQINELKGENRNISLREVSVRVNSILNSAPNNSDIIYGLPSGSVKITHRQKRK